LLIDEDSKRRMSWKSQGNHPGGVYTSQGSHNCCHGFCSKRNWSSISIFILSGAYNLLQLSYFSSEKLGRIDGVSGPEGSSPSVANGSYPSVIHPPHLDPELYHLYQDVTICINISVIISTTLAIVALCQDNSFLLIPWMLSFFISVISETTIFFYLISTGKTSFTPVPAFVLTLDFVLILIQILFLARVYNMYVKMRQGVRISGIQLKNMETGLLVEESSEIASARASSIYRKSFCRRSNKNMNVNKCKKQTSLSKISEEDSENIFTRSDNQHICDDNSIKKVDDKEMFSDKAITNSTSDNQSNFENDENLEESEEAVDNNKNNPVSRFVPEIMARYKVTIV